MKPIKFAEAITINQAAEKLFDYTQDYNKRLYWDTFLTKAELLDGAISAGKGVKAWCVAHNGLGMETEYVSFNRPRVTAVKMTKGPYLFKSFLGSWTFKQISSTHTEVRFLYTYQLRFPFSLAGWLIKRNLQNNVKQRLTDLKMCAEGI